MPMTKEELEAWRLRVREDLKKVRSASSWEEVQRAQDQARWSFALAMDEMAKEENGDPGTAI